MNSELEDLFDAARRLHDPARRRAFLDAACHDDPGLRQELEELLALQPDAQALLDPGIAGFHPGAGELNRLPPALIASVAVQERIGDRVGRYKLREKIGEGGCGVVYVADQEEPVRRRVALKVIKIGMDTKSVIARFDAERQALAIMDHPNIAKVLDAGATETGRPYFVMELVRGIKITEFCDQNRFTTQQRLDLFIKVCQAVQHAHQKGIIHRDLKPSNILVTGNDGVAVPKIIDFGIAKATEGRLTDLTVYTELNQLIGTPAYMSPEQALMTSADIDTRSDIYSLGVLLYELLTGRPPFETKELLTLGLDEMRRTIREKEPLRPSTRLSSLSHVELDTTAKARGIEAPRLCSLVRGDLDWVVMKCLEKDRTRRYATANDLALDLKRHLENEPILARPPSRLYEFQKTVRRHKVGFMATAFVIVALAVGAVVSILEAVHANYERIVAVRAERRASSLETVARREAENARQAEQEAQEKLRASYLAQAQAGRWSGRAGRRFESLELLSKGARIRPGLDLRNEAIACTALADIRLVKEWRARETESTPSFDRRFERYAFTDNLGTVHVCRVEDSVENAKFPGYEPPFRDVTFSPDGEWLLVACGKNGDRIDLLDLKRKEVALSFPGPSYRTIDFTRDGRLAAITYDWANQNWPIQVFDLTSRKQIASFPSGSLPYSVRFNPHQSNQLLVSDSSETVRVWEWQTGNLVRKLPHPNWVVAIDWHPNGELIATGCADNKVRVWDANTGKELFALSGHEWVPYAVTFSFDGQFLASAGWEGMLRLWDLDSRRELLRRPIARWPPNFSSADNRLAVNVGGGKTELLEASAGQGYRALRPPPEEPADFCAFSPDGQLLFSTGKTCIRLWNVRNGRELAKFPIVPRNGFVTPHPDGTHLFSATSMDVQKLVLEKDSSGQYALVPSANFPVPAQYGRLEVTADGRTLATGSVQSGAHFFDIPTGREIRRLDPGCAEVFVAISADGQLAATYSQNEFHVQIWDVAASNIVRQLPVPSPGSIFAAFSPNRRLLVVGNGTEFVAYDGNTWEKVYTLARENAEYWAYMAFSHDSRFLAVTASRTTVLLVEAATGRELARFEPPEPRNINWLTFDQTDARLAVASGFIQLWDLGAIRQQLSLMGLDWEMGATLSR